MTTDTDSADTDIDVLGDQDPIDVLDGVTIAEVGTGDRYTVTVPVDDADDLAELDVTKDDGDTTLDPTVTQLDLWLMFGEFYLPEGDAAKINAAITALKGDE